MDQKEWAAAKAREIKARREKEEADQRARDLQDKQRFAAAPTLWQEFINKVQERVNALNKELGEAALTFKLDTPNAVSVSTRHMTTVHAEFRANQATIHCMLVSTSGEYEVRVVNGQVTLTKGGRGNYAGTSISPDGAAEEFVNDLIQFI